ncbi:hypothetical protein pdam_00006471 [Pocillopora damicornis]|uniref:Uncharacterized protein n=1 Tax=Pocillopora damicornis TaxID=46731 RepID=A0A3M6UY65_POCDA|nr:hypothetical protein pdam_00006471 [Pocillopora damicornis]
MSNSGVPLPSASSTKSCDTSYSSSKILMGGTMVFWMLWRAKHDWADIVCLKCYKRKLKVKLNVQVDSRVYQQQGHNAMRNKAVLVQTWNARKDSTQEDQGVKFRNSHNSCIWIRSSTEIFSRDILSFYYSNCETVIIEAIVKGEFGWWRY